MVIRGEIQIESSHLPIVNGKEFRNGAFFGELPVLNLGVGPRLNKHPYSAKVVHGCLSADLAYLTRDDILRLSNDYTEFRHMVTDMARKRAERFGHVVPIELHSDSSDDDWDHRSHNDSAIGSHIGVGVGDSPARDRSSGPPLRSVSTNPRNLPPLDDLPVAGRVVGAYSGQYACRTIHQFTLFSGPFYDIFPLAGTSADVGVVGAAPLALGSVDDLAAELSLMKELVTKGVLEESAYVEMSAKLAERLVAVKMGIEATAVQQPAHQQKRRGSGSRPPCAPAGAEPAAGGAPLKKHSKQNRRRGSMIDAQANMQEMEGSRSSSGFGNQDTDDTNYDVTNDKQAAHHGHAPMVGSSVSGSGSTEFFQQLALKGLQEKKGPICGVIPRPTGGIARVVKAVTAMCSVILITGFGNLVYASLESEAEDLVNADYQVSKAIPFLICGIAFVPLSDLKDCVVVALIQKFLREVHDTFGLNDTQFDLIVPTPANIYAVNPSIYHCFWFYVMTHILAGAGRCIGYTIRDGDFEDTKDVGLSQSGYVFVLILCDINNRLR